MAWRKPRGPASAHGLHHSSTRSRARQSRSPRSCSTARGDPPPGRRGGGRSARAPVRHSRGPVVAMLTAHQPLLLRRHFSFLHRAERPMSIGRLALVKRAIRGARLGPSRRPRSKAGAGQGAPRGKVAGSKGRLARPSSHHGRRSHNAEAQLAPPGRVARRPHSAVGACAARCRSPRRSEAARRRDPGRRQRTAWPCCSTSTARRCPPTRSWRASLLSSSTLRELYGIHTTRWDLTPRTRARLVIRTAHYS